MRGRLAAVLVAVIVLSACERRAAEEGGHEGEAPAEESRDAASEDDLLRIEPEMLRDLRITTTPAEARPAGEGVTALGELGVDEEVYAEVGSPIAARVVRLLASAGDRVGPDQALVELQSVELGKARADYLAAMAKARLARTTLERRSSLAGERIVPRREVQEAEAAASSAEAELQAAQAALAALGVSTDDVDAGADASRFLLRAPLAGVVIERAAVVGQLADPARPLFRVADLSRLWLTVHAFERDAVRVKVGSPARVEFTAMPGRHFSGTITLVGRQVDAASRTIPIRVDLRNDDGLLRPGMSATACLALDEGAETVVAVPSASLQRLHEGWCVFLPRGEGIFEARRVGRGRELGGEVEVVSGLEPGETIVVDGAFLLKAEAEKARGEGEHHEH